MNYGGENYMTIYPRNGIACGFSCIGRTTPNEVAWRCEQMAASSWADMGPAPEVYQILMIRAPGSVKSDSRGGNWRPGASSQVKYKVQESAMSGDVEQCRT